MRGDEIRKNDDPDTTDADDETMKEVDNMILKATLEMKKVAEENQQVLEIFEKAPKSSRKEDDSQVKSGDRKFVIEESIIKRLERAEQRAKETANRIYEMKTRVAELLKKDELDEEEMKELDKKNLELKEEMLKFEEQTKKIQHLIEKNNIIPIPRDDKKSNKKSPSASTDNSPRSSTKSKRSKSKSRTCSCRSELNSSAQSHSVPAFAKKLSQSYTMQEKLAAENADLESIRYKLQEELLNKDQTVEHLRKELGNLQNEMRIISRQNGMLNEKLKKLEKEEITKSVKSVGKLSKKSSKQFKLREYSDNTYQLEKQLTDMENNVRCLHQEISSVQKEREHLEKHRKMMLLYPSNKRASYSPRISQMYQIYEKFDDGFKSKMNDVNSFRLECEKLKTLIEDAENLKRLTEEKIKEIEKTAKNSSPEIEQKLVNVKKRFTLAQDALIEQNQLIREQRTSIDSLNGKFQDVQKRLDEELKYSGKKN